MTLDDSRALHRGMRSTRREKFIGKHIIKFFNYLNISNNKKIVPCGV